MTLFSSIQVGKNALFASQIGLHVVGNNIANVNTPGYVRQEVLLAPAPAMRYGDLLLGLGVKVEGIIQRSDQFLDTQLRGAASDLASSDAQQQTYLQLEQLLGELNDTDLSSSLTSFFSSIHDILNQPESDTVRNLAVLQGVQLSEQIQQLAQRAQAIRQDLNNRVAGMADQVNSLLADIARLNVQITLTEGGLQTRTSNDASLRHKRSELLDELAEIINIQTVEQPSGGVAVMAAGVQLVAEGRASQVRLEYSPDRGMNVARLELADSRIPLPATSGKLAGLMTSRDEIVGGFMDQLDELTRTLIFEFNRIYSGGQGLKGLAQATSEFSVDAIDQPLDGTGLIYTPENGSFQVLVRDKPSGQTKTSDVFIQLNGFDDDTTLEDLTLALDAIDGISAQVSASRHLIIQADSPDLEFAFRQDTSGVLAALGINTFFSGQAAVGVGVQETVRADPATFAASRDGIGMDTENAVILAGFLQAPLASADDESLATLYERLTTQTSQAASLAESVTDGFRVFHDSLESRQLALSGVSIDEEVVRLIAFQRSFQAAARFISTISELLDDLVHL